MPKHDFATLLRENGLRATPGRLALLTVLAKETRPRSVEDLLQALQGDMDKVTLYRALEALRDAGIVARVNLEHDHAHYELLVGRPHHHHAICRGCGHVEDIEVPHAPALEREAHKRTRGFSHIDRHSLEFFGLCRSCG